MTVLLVIGGILLLLGLLLWLPVSVRVSWREGVPAAALYYACFRIVDFFPVKEAEKEARRAKKDLKKLDKKQVAKEKKKKAKDPEARGAWDTVKLVWELLLDARWALRYLCRHLVIYRVKIRARIAGEDAHRTAVAYAQTGLAVQAGLAVLDGLFRLRSPHVRLAPDFAGTSSCWEVSFRVALRPVTVLVAGINFFWKFFRKLLETRREPKQRKPGGTRPRPDNNNTKGGKNHEPATSRQ